MSYSAYKTIENFAPGLSPYGIQGKIYGKDYVEAVPYYNAPKNVQHQGVILNGENKGYEYFGSMSIRASVRPPYNNVPGEKIIGVT
jgi:hypothetical protein